MFLKALCHVILNEMIFTPCFVFFWTFLTLEDALVSEREEEIIAVCCFYASNEEWKA